MHGMERHPFSQDARLDRHLSQTFVHAFVTGFATEFVKAVRVSLGFSSADSSEPLNIISHDVVLSAVLDDSCRARQGGAPFSLVHASSRLASTILRRIPAGLTCSVLPSCRISPEERSRVQRCHVCCYVQ